MTSTIRYIAIAGLISIWMTSCSDDFLDTTPTSAFTEASYVKNVDELETLLYSCYAAICAYYSSGWPLFSVSTNIWVFGNVGSDDAEKGSAPFDQEDMQYLSMSDQEPDNDWAYIYWMTHYDLIAKCNLVIDKSMEVEGDQKEIEMITDQAKFLRALGFYNLVTIYGGVPMPTKWLDPDELTLQRAPKAEIWAQIEQDLLDASDLPRKSESETGRITHGAVHALLGKVYMWQKKWDKAIQAYTAIIESGEYQLESDYGLIHRHEGENGAESILEFQEAIGVDGGDMLTWLGVFRLSWDNGAGGFGFDNPTQDLVNEFEPGDPRIIYTVNFVGDVFPTPDGDYTVENNGSATGYYTRKAWVPWDERADDRWRTPEMNWRYCRYAEVLLFCAEALNEDGQSDQARIYLNKVRKRARNTPTEDPQRISCAWDLSFTGELLPDVTTVDQNDLRVFIYHEQRVELAQEGHRRWILLRTERFKEAMEKAKGDKGCTVEDHEWLFPIPDWEVNDSHGRIKQNPGYN